MSISEADKKELIDLIRMAQGFARKLQVYLDKEETGNRFYKTFIEPKRYDGGMRMTQKD
jgi:hypothetical protein